MKNIKFAFVRHGYGCHNAMNNIFKNNTNVTKVNFIDPILTDAGVYNTIESVKILKKKIQPELIVCSGLLRSMETAYYISKTIGYKKKIYVVPLLREIDESSRDIYSVKSRNIIDTVPSYAMMSLSEQKKYLKNNGLLQYFDFSYIKHLRGEPGNIKTFIKWFYNNFNSDANSVLAITHAGVLRNYSGNSYTNNDGFILNSYTSNNEIKVSEIRNIGVDKQYNTNKPIHYYCGSGRCGDICKKQ